MIVLGNVANITLFSSTIAGPEQYLAGHPLMIVTFIAAQIVVTAVLIAVLGRRRSGETGARPYRFSRSATAHHT